MTLTAVVRVRDEASKRKALQEKLRRRDTEAWRTSIRAVWKRRRQLLTTDDCRLLVAMREVRQMELSK